MLKANPEVKLLVSMTIRLEDERGQDEERDLENRLLRLHSVGGTIVSSKNKCLH